MKKVETVDEKKKGVNEEKQGGEVNKEEKEEKKNENREIDVDKNYDYISFALPVKWNNYTILCCMISEYYNYGHILHYFKEAAIDYSSVLEQYIVADTKNVQLGFD